MYKDISKVLNIACIKAGQKILKYYSNNIDFKIKADGSPLTKADSEANKIISSELTSFFPNIKIISEEGNHKNCFCKYFLVDPLDGTKEFLNKNGQFTVNIALIENKKPILGSIFQPTKNILYWNDGSYSYSSSGEIKKRIRVTKPANKQLIFEISRSHMDRDTESFLNFYQPSKINRSGSSIKICNLSNGKAHIYPRFSKTSIWDIAAGHAILRNAGGEIFNLDGSILMYDNDRIEIDSFIAYINKKLPNHIIQNAKRV